MITPFPYIIHFNIILNALLPLLLKPGIEQVTRAVQENQVGFELNGTHQLLALVLLQVASISQLTVSRLSRQCRILNISQTYRPPRSVTGIALLYGDGVCFL
jgi:hypothetical protein